MANDTRLNPGTGGDLIKSRDDGTRKIQIVEIGSVPTFWTLTGALTFTASRFQFVLYNNNATNVVEIRRIVYLMPSTAAVTGAASGPWTLRRRVGPTTDPTGTGGISIFGMDNNDSLPSSITAFVNPGTPQAGGTTQDFSTFTPPCDEVKPAGTTIDPSTQAASYDFCGMTLYDHTQFGNNAKPMLLRQDQVLEIQQNATAGTGNSPQILCVFSAYVP